MKKLFSVLLTVAAFAAFTGVAFAECKSADKKCCKGSETKAGECKSADKKCCKGSEAKAGECSKTPAASSKEPTEQSVVIDPACGMDVEVKDAKYSQEYKGKKYYFCSESCFNRFKKSPAKYIGKKAK